LGVVAFRCDASSKGLEVGGDVFCAALVWIKSGKLLARGLPCPKQNPSN
jgi:hypothetical protein